MNSSEEYLKSEECITDAKIAALLKVLEKTHPNIWQEYDDALSDEFLKRNISPEEFPLGYYIKQD